MKELQHALCDFNVSTQPDLIHPNCHEVYANILIGNGQAAMDVEFLVNHNVTHLLNCAKEGKGCKVAAGASFVAPDLARLEAQGISYLGLELSDLPNEDISKTFPLALDWMDQALLSGGRLLVNCWVGRSRSATLVLAYLVKFRNVDLVEAVKAVKAKRDIHPNQGFLQQLVELEMKIKNI